ncbi:MAG: hypothetical protein KIT17_09635 [Rubrivivax sp.]|nr:hypothetical protein [Rubrivivax sp.]
MRILFVAVGGRGHVQPLLGLTLQAHALGHTVAWATARSEWPLLQALGIETFEAGRPLEECVAEFQRNQPDLAHTPPRDHALHAFPGLFARVVAPPMLAALAGIVGRWRPALVVGEPAALAAPLAARAAGVPFVAHEFGLPLPRRLLERAAEVMAPAWRAAGLAVDADAGVYAEAVVRIVPPRLAAAGHQPPPAARLLAQQPASVHGVPGAPAPETLARFLERQEGRPLLYVTFGTLHAAAPPWQRLLATLRELPAACVVTCGPRNEPPRDLPAHWWADRYLPQATVLPHCSAVVSHGGAGTALAAAALGLPQLCLPQGADQFRNTDALAACGAALAIEGPIEPRALAEAVNRLLEDPPLRVAAQALGSEFQQLPEAAATAVELARMFAIHQGGRRPDHPSDSRQAH